VPLHRLAAGLDLKTSELIARAEQIEGDALSANKPVAASSKH
jgi:hypothetical protein